MDNRTVVSLCCGIALGMNAWGGDARISSTVVPDSLTVGDPVRLRVCIVPPESATVVPPATGEGFGDFRVREWSSEKRAARNADSLLYSYDITTYSVGPCSIPSLPFILKTGDRSDTLHTRPHSLRVVSVLPDDSVDIRDLKSPQQAGTPSRWWLWVAAACAVVALCGAAVRYAWRRFRRGPPPPPPKPPLEEAMDALRVLRARRLLERGLLREYAFGLSEILKRYTGRRFSINAAEFTTEEMLEWLKNAPLPVDERTRAVWFFEHTHPVKFAKHVPDEETLRKFDLEVERFVMNTRPSVMEQCS